MEDTELVKGLVLSQKSQGSGGPNRVEKAKIGLIQFCISPPKTDVSHYLYVFTVFVHSLCNDDLISAVSETTVSKNLSFSTY